MLYIASRFYEDLDFDLLSKEIAINTVSLLNPKSFETKSLPVVFSPDSMVSLLRAFSSVFLGDSLIKNKNYAKRQTTRANSKRRGNYNR